MAKSSRVIGIRPYSFKPEDSDTILEGYTLWLGDVIKDCIGFMPYKVSFGKNKMLNFLDLAGLSDVGDLLGLNIELSYDRYGKASGFEVVLE